MSQISRRQFLPTAADFWEDDGTPEFQRLWKLAESGVTWTDALAGDV